MTILQAPRKKLDPYADPETADLNADWLKHIVDPNSPIGQTYHITDQALSQNFRLSAGLKHLVGRHDQKTHGSWAGGNKISEGDEFGDYTPPDKPPHGLALEGVYAGMFGDYHVYKGDPKYELVKNKFAIYGKSARRYGIAQAEQLTNWQNSPKDAVLQLNENILNRKHAEIKHREHQAWLDRFRSGELTSDKLTPEDRTRISGHDWAKWDATKPALSGLLRELGLRPVDTGKILKKVPYRLSSSGSPIYSITDVIDAYHVFRKSKLPPEQPAEEIPPAPSGTQLRLLERLPLWRLKHLPGAHDQKTHGSWATGGQETIGAKPTAGQTGFGVLESLVTPQAGIEFVETRQPIGWAGRDPAAVRQEFMAKLAPYEKQLEEVDGKLDEIRKRIDDKIKSLDGNMYDREVYEIRRDLWPLERQRKKISKAREAALEDAKSDLLADQPVISQGFNLKSKMLVKPPPPGDPIEAEFWKRPEIQRDEAGNPLRGGKDNQGVWVEIDYSPENYIYPDRTSAFSHQQSIDVAQAGLTNVLNYFDRRSLGGEKLLEKVNLAKAPRRAYYNDTEKVIGVYDVGEYAGKAERMLVYKSMAHEFGHWIEDRFPSAKKAAQDFLNSRISKDKAGNPKTKPYKVKNYSGEWLVSETEKLYVGKFIDPYMGKVYKGATEILSMGFELFMFSPDRLARRDPELFDLVLGVLQGNIALGKGSKERFKHLAGSHDQKTHGSWAGGKNEVIYNEGGEKVTRVNDARDILKNFSTIAVGVLGKDKGDILGSSVVLAHSRMIELAGGWLDNYVRFNRYYEWDKGYIIEANTNFAGVSNEFIDEEYIPKAVDNIFEATRHLVDHGLDKGVRIRILQDPGGIIETTLKHLPGAHDQKTHGQRSGAGDISDDDFLDSLDGRPGINRLIRGMSLAVYRTAKDGRPSIQGILSASKPNRSLSIAEKIRLAQILASEATYPDTGLLRELKIGGGVAGLINSVNSNFEIEVKHMMGHHDQLRHGYRYGSGSQVKRTMRNIVEAKPYPDFNNGDPGIYTYHPELQEYKRRVVLKNNPGDYELAYQRAVYDFVQRNRNNANETGLMIDRRTGEVLNTQMGNAAGVDIYPGLVRDLQDKTNNNIIVIHNHPTAVKGGSRRRGMLSVSALSEADISFATRQNLKGIRAVSPSGFDIEITRNGETWGSDPWEGYNMINRIYNTWTQYVEIAGDLAWKGIIPDADARSYARIYQLQDMAEDYNFTLRVGWDRNGWADAYFDLTEEAKRGMLNPERTNKPARLVGLKHLPGGHDQKTHGSWAAGGAHPARGQYHSAEEVRKAVISRAGMMEKEIDAAEKKYHRIARQGAKQEVWQDPKWVKKYEDAQAEFQVAKDRFRNMSDEIITKDLIAPDPVDQFDISYEVDGYQDWQDDSPGKPAKLADVYQSFSELRGIIDKSILVDAGSPEDTDMYHHALRTVTVKHSEGDRSYCYANDIFLVDMHPKYSYAYKSEERFPGMRSSVFHEMGHVLENFIPGLRQRNEEFLRIRAAGEELQTFGFINEGEKYFRDRFLDPYMGKYYDGYSATEILSMGMDYLCKFPAAMAREDPEYFNFVIDTLHGYSRRQAPGV